MTGANWWPTTDADYDEHDEIDLSRLEPLIAHAEQPRQCGAR